MQQDEKFICSKCDCPSMKCAPMAAHKGEGRGERIFGIIYQCVKCGHRMLAHYHGIIQTFRDYEHMDGDDLGFH